MKIEVINDFYSTVIFYEYVKNNNFLNNILKKESANIYQDMQQGFDAPLAANNVPTHP